MCTTDRHDELVALLTEIRDRLLKPEGVNAVEDEPACDCGAADGYHAPDCPRAPFPPEPAPADDGLAEWERELLRPATCCGKCPPIAGGGYDCTCEGNPRCEKADTPEEWHGNPAPADEDPDEALARVLYETECEVRWEGAGAVARDTYRDLARAAREHIFEEQAAARYEERITQVKSEYHDYTQRAEKAEADLARVTKERDEWKSRHAALRAGVERARRNRTTLTDVLMCIADVLDLDDAHERTDPAP